MKIELKNLALAGAAALTTLCLAATAHATVFSVTLTMDENGHGTFTNTSGFHATLASGLQNDPGPGGLSDVLTYDLLNPPGLTAGDVLINEAGVGLDDVVRFNPGETGPGGGTGSLVFYSNPIDGGLDSKADTPSPPGAFYTNTITLDEVKGRVVYTPTSGEPGFVAGAGGPVTYVLISDSVPEPASWALMMLGVAAAGGALRLRRKAVIA
ncbi:MAG TPA: PEPxxWA-CTERM sorting domain-containing protein [Caulobacteraceae bacterium]|nr:PEPxxWA-CTERM sorting domain-containing protein [Caulobacteraceae bacterium]